MKKITKFLTTVLFISASVFFTTELFAESSNSTAYTSSRSNLKEIENSVDVRDNYSNKLIVNPQLAASSRDYLVTAGDIYQLGYAIGGTKITYPIVVDPTYTIKVSNLGNLNANGLTFVDLKKQVEDIVSKNYPMSGVQLVIESPAVFKVTVMGEVNETVEKQTWGLMRLSSVIENELTDYASKRNVEVTSKNGKVHTYDLFKAKRDGDLSQDPYLRPDDVISVHRFERKVSITGAVERPGSYELLEGENLKDLIEVYAGGLIDRADTSRIEISRTYDVVHSAGKNIYTNSKAIDENYEMQNNDSVYIASYYDLRKVVFFEGAVNILTENETDTSLVASNKIPVYVEDDENYAFLIRRNKNILSSLSDMKNAYIRRGDKIIPIDIEKVLYDADFMSDEVIENYDTLMIPFAQSFVTVAGAVKNPGRYPYIPDRTWEYYIGLAGGFVKNQNSMDMISIKDKNDKKLSKDDPITPESTITARTNAFIYYFSTYAPIITTTLSVISTMFTVMIYSQSLN